MGSSTNTPTTNHSPSSTPLSCGRDNCRWYLAGAGLHDETGVAKIVEPPTLPGFIQPPEDTPSWLQAQSSQGIDDVKGKICSRIAVGLVGRREMSEIIGEQGWRRSGALEIFVGDYGRRGGLGVGRVAVSLMAAIGVEADRRLAGMQAKAKWRADSDRYVGFSSIGVEPPTTGSVF
ncbi:hypothetical protein PM082_015405 [Marasmius tenuissimus]|nr:hypothetical protein PM082_015405 [Marasmius tenuissimus]